MMLWGASQVSSFWDGGVAMAIEEEGRENMISRNSRCSVTVVMVSLNDLHLISQSRRVYESHHSISLSNTVRHTEMFTRSTPPSNSWGLKDFQAFRNRAEFYILEGQMSSAPT